jgi:hypothetical protein
MKKILSLILLFTFSSLSTFAHQPRIIKDSIIEVEEPTVSKAYYAELTGQPDVYIVDSEEAFDLYIGILVPAIEGIDKDVSAKVFKEEEELYFIDGENFEWYEWFEPFSGDDYFYGPELKDPSSTGPHPAGINVEAGTYEIHISSPDNEGKYVMAIGEKEEFPVGEITHVLFTLPELKSDYFEQSIFTAYYNLSGVFFLFIIVAGTTITILGIKIYKKFNKKKNKKKKS